MPARRTVLRLLGGAALVSAAGGTAWALTRDPAAAREPWQAAGTTGDPRLDALSWAVLAPNPHNRQPWLITLPAPGEITLHVDRDRLLPHTDPHSRQIVIGLGCFLETLAVAATAQGLRAEITPFPEGADPRTLDARPVAHIRLTEGAPRDPLFAQIPHRRSCKEPFEARLPAPESLPALAAEGARLHTDPAEVDRLKAIAWRAHEIEVNTPRTLQESIDLMRIGKAEITANPDGIDLGGPFLETLSLLGQLDRESLADPDSAAFAQGLAMYREIHEATSAHLSVTGPATRLGEIEAGRRWQRIHLAATAEGLSLHPVSQALQEFPEMAEPFAALHAAIPAPEGERVHMLGRLGYGPETPASPRWPLETRIRSA